jgi:imidazole glycerol-phosphate synthase subunit HisF
MLRTRVIPSLLLRNGGLVKTVRFRNPTYVGDPINAVRIFNDKEVDELVFLDITASIEGARPNMRLLGEIAEECFMPLAYGGGLRTVEDVKAVIALGVEKISFNSAAAEDPDFVSRAADAVGSQSVVVSIDVRKSLFGKYEVHVRGGRRGTGLDPAEFAVAMQKKGAGEILLNAIDRDGTQQGYDIDLIRRVTSRVSIPVIACGGAGRIEDFSAAVKDGGASAVAAGSMFVFRGKHRAVLISYPSRTELEKGLL